MTFLQKLQAAQKNQDALLCIGLDVDEQKIPSHLSTSPSPVLEFNKRIIEATYDLICAYKLNLAFYESLGEQGWRTVQQTLSLIPKDVLTIGDGKRGDIGNTSEHYVKVLFSDFGFDAATVNPYMGFDSVEPFILDSAKGVFVLALTSNPGSKDFQRVKVAGRPIYEKVVIAAKKWNTNGNIGLVVGATHPKELKSIRKIAPDLPLLIPGVGKQGGDLKSSVGFGCDKKGRMAIINVGRSIIYASSANDFASVARREAIKLRDQIRRHQEEFFG
ncbi:MAG: orotidine-5'-phosphate decarboxylase [Ignavibacteriales bacterium]|nr:orotidine-5'-phosphate decarboxylase [Ignavibacteriales bacterium]